jgi:hypothetical protein
MVKTTGPAPSRARLLILLYMREIEARALLFF